MQDLMIRWNCSRGFVGKQISRGLPMKKLSTGRWSIKENDLINWERFLEDERKKARRNSTIATIVGVLITIIVIALFAKVCLVTPMGQSVLNSLKAMLG